MWPIVRYVAKSPTWQQNPDASLVPIADAMVDLWPLAALVIDEDLRE